MIVQCNHDAIITFKRLKAQVLKLTHVNRFKIIFCLRIADLLNTKPNS